MNIRDWLFSEFYNVVRYRGTTSIQIVKTVIVYLNNNNENVGA